MKKILALFFAICLLFSGCGLQIGNTVLFAKHYKTAEKAYMQNPYSDPIQQLYLDEIEKEVACVSLTEEYALWICVANDGNMVETLMHIDKKGYFYSLGNAIVSDLSIADEFEALSPTETEWTFKVGSDSLVYSWVYTDSQYDEVQSKLGEKYSAIPFETMVNGNMSKFVYVYKYVNK